MRILVVYKKSRYEQLVIEEHDPDIERLLAEHDISVERLIASHQAHTRSLDQIVEVLTRHGFDFDVLPRGTLQGSPQDYDLLVTVGGDGTLLDLSHAVTTTPVLAINSDPSSSVGYFCAGRAEEFEGLLERALSGALRPTALKRFAVDINQEQRTLPVLNEILICQANPAAVSSYFLRIDGHEEAQRSSGIWISTPAGSTAAIRSAGGMVMPLGSNNVQYVVREPYQTSKRNYRQLKGIRPFGTEIEIVSKMQHGRIYVDGPHIEYPFRIGDRLRLLFDVPDLSVYGLEERRRMD